MQCPRCNHDLDRGEYSCPACGLIIGLNQGQSQGQGQDSDRFDHGPGRFRRQSEPLIEKPAHKARVEYAGFSFRLLALSIDGLILGLLTLPWNTTFFPFDIPFSWGHCSVSSLSLPSFWGILIGWVYFPFFESSKWQGTPGKLLCGMKVTDLEGKRLLPARALGRYFAKVFFTVFFFFGYFFAIFTHRKQALHDLVAGTLVVLRD
jgi:uncharacterized RDD family membrane protein YckC